MTEEVLLLCVSNYFAHGIKSFKRGSLTNILSNSCISGFIEIIQTIISCGKPFNVNYDSKSKNKHSPLFYASEFGHLEIVKLLLSVDNIDVNAHFPLLVACSNKHKDIILLLLSHHECDPNIISNKGCCETFPLIEAVRYDYKDITRLLLACPKVNVNL